MAKKEYKNRFEQEKDELWFSVKVSIALFVLVMCCVWGILIWGAMTGHLQ